MTVFTKLSQARERFHSLSLKKTGHNKFAGYYYFELGDFLIPALQVFREVGLLAYVSFDKDVATMTIVDMESADRMEITSPMGSAALKGCHEVQNIGAVETYQRRYLWVAALEIVEHDALDATTGKAGATADAKHPTLPASVRSSPLADENGTRAIDLLPTEEREYLQELAMEVIATCKADPRAAVVRVDLENLENEQKLGLWSILDSKTRSAFKKAQQTMREEATA